MHRRTELSRITRFCYTPAGRISTLASPKSGYVPRVRYRYFDVKHFETVLLNLVNLTPVPLLDWDRSGALSIFEYFFNNPSPRAVPRENLGLRLGPYYVIYRMQRVDVLG